MESFSIRHKSVWVPVSVSMDSFMNVYVMLGKLKNDPDFKVIVTGYIVTL